MRFAVRFFPRRNRHLIYRQAFLDGRTVCAALHPRRGKKGAVRKQGVHLGGGPPPPPREMSIAKVPAYRTVGVELLTALNIP